MTTNCFSKKCLLEKEQPITCKVFPYAMLINRECKTIELHKPTEFNHCPQATEIENDLKFFNEIRTMLLNTFIEYEIQVLK